MSLPDEQNPYRSPAVPAAGEPLGANDRAGEVSAGSLLTLKQTRPWVRFMSVLLFLSAALLVAAGMVGGAVQIANGNTGGAEFGAVLALYVAIGALYILPGVFLWQYATRITALLDSPTVGRLEHALQAQKSFWKFVGISAAIVMALYAVVLAIALVGVVLLRLN
jgi:hypothetical protein